MQNFFIFFTIMMVVGCNSGTDKKASEHVINTTADTGSSTPKAFKNTTVDGCYLQILNRDTFAASLQQQENLVHGRMSFDNYEKDASAGTVSGILENDILKLNYTFMSEGMISVMELYFKYKDGVLIRGTGEMNSNGDKTYFINPASVNYDGGELKKISCETLAEKYK